MHMHTAFVWKAERIIGQEEINVVHDAAKRWAAKVLIVWDMALQVINYYKLMILKTAITPGVVNYLVSTSWD